MLRGLRLMIDADLAALYGVTTKLKFPHTRAELPFSINHLRWISGLVF